MHLFIKIKLMIIGVFSQLKLVYIRRKTGLIKWRVCTQIVIAQLRIGFSVLNSHLFNKGCVESPLCLCGNVCEDTKHFLMICPLYGNIRTTLLTRLQQLNLHVPINHKLLLYGNTRLTSDTDLLIQEHLSAYLIESKRFLHNHNRQNWILECLSSTFCSGCSFYALQSFPIPHSQTSP